MTACKDMTVKEESGGGRKTMKGGMRKMQLRRDDAQDCSV